MYKWGIDGKGSVDMSTQVKLPQFKVKDWKQDSKVESISTGNLIGKLRFFNFLIAYWTNNY